jgi:hypothetical protein
MMTETILFILVCKAKWSSVLTAYSKATICNITLVATCWCTFIFVTFM